MTTASPNFLGAYATVGMLVGVNRGKVNNVYATGAVNGSGYTHIGGLAGENYGSISNSRSGGAVVLGGYYGAGGLVGYNQAGGLISNSSASGAVSASEGQAGGLVYFNIGTISNSFATGAVTAGQSAGGLVAQNRNVGIIQYSFATGSVSGNNSVGGLVGWNDAASKINNSYATGAITGSNGPSQNIGGLVGKNASGAQVNNSYATGAVSGTSAVGGVAGLNDGGGTLSNVYASGQVTGSSNVGGVIGQNSNSSLSNGYFNSTLNPTRSLVGIASGSGTGTGGGSGLTAVQMKTASNFAGFTFTTTPGATGNNWVMVNTDGSFNSTTGTGATLPMLASEWSNTISSAHQLQLMGMSLTAQYVLANDIAAATTASSTLDVWNGGSFIPVGASGATPFAGRFDGAGHTIYGLVVNRSGIDYAGLFGATASSAYIANVGLEGGSITGKNYTGALVGSNAGTVNGSFSTVSVTGASQVGGLVGYSSGTVSNNYASGAVSGTDSSGGLVGANAGTLTNNYANGVVSGTSNAGGLAGTNSGASSGNFWDSSASGKASSATGTGLSTAQLKTLSIFSAAGWDLGGTWIVYDGNSTPLLRSFMTPLYVNFNGTASKTYDGTNSWTAPTYTYSTVTDSRLQGTLNYGAAGSAINAGTYAITAGGLYSGQHGYVISNNAATLTIAQLGVTLGGATVINRAYDGTTNASLSGGSLTGVLAQDLGSVQFNTGVFASQNAGNGIAVTAVVTGSAGGNYVITASGSLTGNITPKALTVSGLSVASKQYDGNTGATFTGGSLNGLVGNETLSLANLAGTYADANAGTGKAVAVNPNTLSNGTGLASNYTLTAPTGIVGAITPRVLTISGMTAANKTYDATTDAFLSGGSLSNLVNGETLGFSGSTGVFSDKNAGNGKSVTVSGTTLQNGTGLASNYTISNPANVTANISKATVSSVSGILAGNKVYDGTVAASLNAAGASFAGMVGGDNLTVSSASGSFSDKNAGNGKTVNISGLALGGADAGNYNLSNTTASSTADISKASITGVSGLVAGNKVYDGTAAASLNTAGASFAGMVGGDNLTVSNASGSFSDKNAGNGKAVNVSGIVLGGTDAGNYNLASDTASSVANISAKTLTLTGLSGNKVYDGTVNATLAGGTLNGLVGLETLGLSVQSSYNDKNVGTNKPISVNGVTLSDGTGLASNYTVAAPAGVTGTITKATISSVTGLTALDNNGKIAGDDLQLFSASGAFMDKNVGSNKTVNIAGITLSGSDLGNYNFINNTATATASITPKAVTLSGVTAGNKVYDGTTAAVLSGGNLIGVVSGETLSFSGGVATFSDKNAGVGKVVTISGTVLQDGTGLASNYSFTSPGNVTADISKATISSVTNVGVNNKTYDGSDIATLNGAGTFNGMVSGDSLMVAGNGAFGDKNAGAGKTVAVTGLTLSGTDAGNYNLAITKGSTTADITQKALTVTGATAADKTYDGTSTATLSGGSLTGMVSGETLVLTGASGEFSDKNAGNGKVVTVTGGNLGNGSGLASNYTIGSSAAGTANITPKTLTVTGVTATNKIYDGLLQAVLSGGSLSGLVGNEALTLDLSGQTGTFASKNVGNNIAIDVTGAVITNGTGLVSNYAFSNAFGVTGNITPKALTVTGVTAMNKIYDGLLQAVLSGGSLSGLVSGEALNLDLSGQTGAFASKNVGNNIAVNVTGAIVTDSTGLASNYAFSNASGVTANITPKALTVTGVTAANKVYDGSLQAALSGGSLSGLVSGETLTLNLSNQAGAFADKNAGSSKVINVTGATVTDGTGLASNYIFSNASGVTASITSKALTVTGQVAGNKVYDGNTVAQLIGGSLSGLVGDETLGIASQTAAFSDKNAANAKAVTVSGTTLLDGSGAASNYTVTNPTGLTASITPKAVTVIGQVAGNKVYDGTVVAQLIGGSLSGLVGDETLGIAGQTANFSDKNAANAKTVTVSGTTLLDGSGAASNYSVSNPTGLTASITPKAVTVIGQVAGNKVYDGNTVAQLIGGSLSGLVGDETLGIGGQTAAFSDKNAANAKTVTVSGTTLLDGSGSASNYSVSNPTGLTASITPKAVTVIGQVAGNKVYDGNTVAQLSGGSLIGLVGDETLSIGGQTANFGDKNAANAKTVTVSGTTLLDGSGSASNYSVSNPTGLTASITPKALTVVGQVAGNKVYDGNTAARLIGGSLSGLVGSETLAIGGQTASFSDKNAANAKTVTVSGTTLLDAGSGTTAGSASNYTVSNPTGLTASITPASISGVSGIVAANKVYDGSTAASLNLSGASFNGMVAGDALSLAGGPVRGAFSDKNAATGKTVTISGLGLSGADAGNYVLASNQASTTASISQAALTVKVDNAEKDQGRVNPPFSASYNGLVAGDTLANEVSGNLLFSTPATTGSPAGNYLVSASGQASNNYALNYVDGVLKVNPTEALQSAIASVIATIAVAPSQGNMVQADMIASGDTGPAAPGATAEKHADSNAPVVQLSGNVISNVLPGLRLSVVNNGLRLPIDVAAGVSQDSQ
ncbi:MULTISPECIES: YDG domain-containing protein [unclassified Janthinobacterium]|uniref:YDG domain-containing protein n=1 Tax=unclassified Janthinobacterium TaxID=2610881 RepID=UPI0016157CB9|nr:MULTISPECIES: YDG domain-containing protein [unclassified Janthinobacterium]MBB5608880.1 hypothetical protein [Janthinobacterium sp. S3T4]MBB5615265.1 hypothetical protein [Janthinobacterium sp. S3M3]